MALLFGVTTLRTRFLPGLAEPIERIQFPFGLHEGRLRYGLGMRRYALHLLWVCSGSALGLQSICFWFALRLRCVCESVCFRAVLALSSHFGCRLIQVALRL